MRKNPASFGKEFLVNVLLIDDHKNGKQQSGVRQLIKKRDGSGMPVIPSTGFFAYKNCRAFVPDQSRKQGASREYIASDQYIGLSLKTVLGRVSVDDGLFFPIIGTVFCFFSFLLRIFFKNFFDLVPFFRVEIQ